MADEQGAICICGGVYTMCEDGHAINCPASNQINAYRSMIAVPAADEQGAIPEALERLFDQAFTDGIAAGKSGDESILAGSSAVYARSALTIVAADRLTDTGEGKPCDFWLGDCRRCGKRADRDNQQEPCARPNGPFAPLATHKTADAGEMREQHAQVAECAFDDRPRSRVGHPSHMDWEDGYREGTRAAAVAIRNLPDAGEPL